MFYTIILPGIPKSRTINYKKFISDSANTVVIKHNIQITIVIAIKTARRLLE